MREGDTGRHPDRVAAGPGPARAAVRADVRRSAMELAQRRPALGGRSDRGRPGRSVRAQRGDAAGAGARSGTVAGTGAGTRTGTRTRTAVGTGARGASRAAAGTRGGAARAGARPATGDRKST